MITEPDWLAPTKLSVPPRRPGLLARVHLVDALHTALTHARLTLISAAAGFGKTTLVQAWHAGAAGRTVPLAWLALDAADNDPVRFWTGLVAALRKTSGEVDARTLATLSRLQTRNVDVLVPGLIRELTQLDHDVVLVLDEYEVIESPAIHRELGLLVEQLPVRMHLLMTTRADPPLPIARFRARGWLAEIRTPDLRLREDEVATFIGDVMGITHLSGPEITLLSRRTEGWVAGVQLVALSLRNRPDTSTVLAELSTTTPRFVVDYLVEDVLARLPEDVRNFLRQTAILNRLCGPLCDAVTRGSDGQAMLEHLERANLFVSPLDAERRWYRYHGLFAEVLRLRLRQTNPELSPVLHGRAAAWFAAMQMSREAVEHALAAGNSAFAADQIARVHRQLFADGEHATLQRWLEQVSEGVLDLHPPLRVVLAWTHFQLGQWRLLAGAIATAECSAVASADVVAQGTLVCLQAWWSVLRADGPAGIAAATRGLTLLPLAEPYWRQAAIIGLGWANLLEGHPTAAQACLSAQPPTIGDLSILAEVSHQRGDLHQAMQLYGEVQHLAGVLSVDPAPANLPDTLATMRGGWVTVAAHIDALVLQADVRREWNQLSAAEELLREALALAPRYGQAAITTKGQAQIVYGRLLASQGRTAEALDALAQAARDAEAIDSPSIRAAAIAYAMRVRLGQGESRTVLTWSKDVGGDLLQYVRQAEAFTVIRVWLKGGAAAQAGELLESLRAAAEESGRLGSLAEILSLQAQVLWANRAPDRALSLLAKAMALAEPGGYVRLFADDGPALVPVLAELAAAQRPGRLIPPSREYVRAVLIAAGGAGAQSAQSKSTYQTLSARELEVLRLMATGAPNDQIARELVIGSTTVKSHVNGIFHKLGASNRLEAVSRARATGLFQPD